MTLRDAQLMQRIVKYCYEIEQTIEYFGADEKRFLSDFIMRNAVCMPLQQIGELATPYDGCIYCQAHRNTMEANQRHAHVVCPSILEFELRNRLGYDTGRYSGAEKSM